jgi:hypothetical protein
MSVASSEEPCYAEFAMLYPLLYLSFNMSYVVFGFAKIATISVGKMRYFM